MRENERPTRGGLSVHLAVPVLAIPYALGASFRPSIFDCDSAALNPSQLPHACYAAVVQLTFVSVDYPLDGVAQESDRFAL